MRKKSRVHKKTALIILVITVALSPFLFKLGRAVPVMWQYFFNKEIELKDSSRVNVLLLGIGGGKHEGPNLTDTMIFASIDVPRNKATLVSVPRDLWVPELKAKINTAYATGESKRKGQGGIILSEAVLEKILGQPIDYTVRVDFDGFVKAIDSLGGIDVDVKNSFDDYEYPVEGRENDTCGHSDEEFEKLATSSSQLEAFPCRYMHLHFDRGLQRMDGEKALQYVRSRHAKGREGTDFARSERQTKVISAVKQKTLSVGTLLNPIKIISFYSALRQNIDTNIKENEFDDFIKLAQNLRGAQVVNASLEFSDDPENALLVNPPISSKYGFQYVLIPQAGDGNFSDIHSFVDCKVNRDNC